MSKQPKALRLADALYDNGEVPSLDECSQAAAELRRLHAVNAELLEALQGALAMLERADCSTGCCCCGSAMQDHGITDGHGPVDEGDHHQLAAMERARAAIRRATEEA